MSNNQGKEIRIMKSYTDLEQSKKLAEILPTESADMWWAERYAGQVMPNGLYIVEENPVYYPSLTNPSKSNNSQDVIKAIPCWSLAALLNVLPDPSLHEIFSGWRCDSNNKECTSCIFGEESDNSVDACYKMIVKLHELKKL